MKTELAPSVKAPDSGFEAIKRQREQATDSTSE